MSRCVLTRVGVCVIRSGTWVLCKVIMVGSTTVVVIGGVVIDGCCCCSCWGSSFIAFGSIGNVDVGKVVVIAPSTSVVVVGGGDGG